MQRLKSEITYKVPSWNFCNSDTYSVLSGKVSKDTCRFCVKKGGAYRCMLHDEPLNYDGTFIEKTQGCKVASVGVAIEILDPAPPQVEPKQLMRMTIDEYNKQVKDLVATGYPYPMATKLAKQYVLGE